MSKFFIHLHRLTFILLVSFTLLGFTAHKYYFSLTDIQYNPKNASLEIITNVFIDDIELELNKAFDINLQLNTKNQYVHTDSVFKSYFLERLKMKVDDKAQSFKYLGIEFDGDLVYIYMEATNVLNPKKFEVSNKILLDNFEDQQNVVKIKVNKARKSDILNLKNVKTVLKF